MADVPCVPPVLSLDLIPSVVQGEPLYGRFQVQNPNQFGLLVYVGPEATGWRSLLIDGAALPKWKTGREGVRPGFRSSKFRRLDGHSLAKEVFFVCPTFELADGEHVLTVRSKISYWRADTADPYWVLAAEDDENVPSGPSEEREDDLRFKVEPYDSERLKAAAYRIARTLGTGDPLAFGFEGGGLEVLDGLLTIPSKDAADAWRTVALKTGPGHLSRLAETLAIKHDSFADQFLEELRVLAKGMKGNAGDIVESYIASARYLEALNSNPS